MCSGGSGKAVIGADCGSGKAVVVVGGVVIEVVVVVVVAIEVASVIELSEASGRVAAGLFKFTLRPLIL